MIILKNHIKKELLLKEINYSQNHVLLDALDDVHSMNIDFVKKCIDPVTTGSKKNAVITACNSKYFRSCLTLITSLRKHSEKDIDVIYVFDLGLTEKEQHVLLNLEKVEFIPMIEILQYTQSRRCKFPEFLTPNQFAWKPWFIRFVFESSDVQMYFG